VWNVGLLESRQCQQLAVSADAIAWVTSVAGDSARYELMCVEIKTRVTAAKVNEAKQLAADMNSVMHATWIDVELGSDDFKMFVPEILYRRQITHQLLVTQAPACLYVVAEQGGSVIYKLTVRRAARILSDHRAACDKLIAFLGMKWSYPMRYEDVDLPPNMPPPMCADFLSHYWLWASMRQHVLRHGPFKPPIHRLYHSFQVMYNLFMGGIDKSSQRFQEFKFAGVNPPWPAHIVMRGVGTCAINAWHCFKLHEVRQYLKEGTYRSLKFIRSRMNRGRTFKDFIRRVGRALLLHPESILGFAARQTSPEGQITRDHRHFHPVAEDVARLDYLQQVARRNKYQVAHWFNTNEGKQLRSWKTVHAVETQGKKQCSFCTLLRRQASCKRQPTSRCSTCCVHLCTRTHRFPKTLVDVAAGDGEEIMASCFMLWHKLADLPTIWPPASGTNSADDDYSSGDSSSSKNGVTGLNAQEGQRARTPLSSRRAWHRHSPSRPKRTTPRARRQRMNAPS